MQQMRAWVTMGAAALAVVAAWNQGVGGAPAAGIELTSIGVYETGLFDEGAVEISAYDPASKRAFFTYAEQSRIGIVDLSDPESPVDGGDISLLPWGEDGVVHATSVAVHNGVLAVAVPQGDEDTGDPGKALFFSAQTGVLLNEVTVGHLPDMITFSPDGNLVLTADEGQPLDDYSFDPEGTVSVIDVSEGIESFDQGDVTTIGFSDFNDKPLDPSIRIFGPGATVAQDLEPEYVAVSQDSKIAWVTLQENNAIAKINLTQKQVVSLVGLGFKDHSRKGSGLDGGLNDGGNIIARWPVRGMYQPDGIAVLTQAERTYLVTANEGDVREYDGLNDAGNEAVEVKDIGLDPDVFPDAATLQSQPNGIARLKVSRFMGNSDADDDYEGLYAFGARSFSIWSDDGKLVFDSGDAFEQITKERYPSNFNASNTSNSRDNRSDDKGPEPEGVTVATLFGRDYAFVMLERIGGVMVYDVTNATRPAFVQYINMRSFAQAPAAGVPAGTDLGAEAARFIDAESSPNGNPLLIVSNEVSGTLRVFEISQAD